VRRTGKFWLTHLGVIVRAQHAPLLVHDEKPVRGPVRVFRTRRYTHDLLADFLVQTVLILPCILAFSVAYFVLIERPCMDPAWPQKLRAALSRNSRRPEAA
jgi:hypothetical protein